MVTPVAFRSAASVSTTSAPSSVDCPAPSGIVDDDLLIYILGRAVIRDTIVWPTDFVELDDGVFGVDSLGSLAVAWKRASSETGTYVASWSPGGSATVGIMFAISGANTLVAPGPLGSIAAADTANPDPPSVDPGYSERRLAIAMYAINLKNTTVTPPLGYTEPTNGDDASTGPGSPGTHVSMGASYLVYVGQAEDPPQATYGSTGEWGANTLLIDPMPSSFPPRSARSLRFRPHLRL